MKMIFIRLFLMSFVLFYLSSCSDKAKLTVSNTKSDDVNSDSDSDSDSETNSINQVKNILLDSIPKFSTVDNNFSYTPIDGGNKTGIPLEDWHSVTDFIGANGPVNYLKNLGDDSSVKSIGYEAELFSFSCLVEEYVPHTTSEIIQSGTYTKEIDSEMVNSEICLPKEQTQSLLGASIKFVVSNLDDADAYDFKIILSLLFNSQELPIGTVYFTKNTSLLKILFVNSSRNDDFNLDDINIISFQFNQSTSIGIYQLFRKSRYDSGVDSGSLLRVFFDKNNNQTKIFNHYHDGTGGETPPRRMTIATSSNYTSPSQTSVSISWSNQIGYSNDLNLGTACVSNSNGRILQNETDCASLIAPAANSSTFDSVLHSKNFETLQSFDYKSTVPEFDSTNIHYASLGF